MNTGETSLGGPDRAFRTTIWSDVLAAGSPERPDSREKLTALLKTYWRPVYAYVRLAWHKPVEEAKDLTQSFFAHLLEKEAWAQLTPERGTFRSWLRRALKNFLINAQEHQEVRRPVAPVVSFDGPALPEPADPAEAPDRAFDREWSRLLMEDSIAALKTFLEGEGKGGYFEIFQRTCLEGDDAGYRDVAGRLGISETDVRNHLSYARRVLQRILRERVRDTVADDADVERELREAAGG